MLGCETNFPREVCWHNPYHLPLILTTSIDQTGAEPALVRQYTFLNDNVSNGLQIRVCNNGGIWGNTDRTRGNTFTYKPWFVWYVKPFRGSASSYYQCFCIIGFIRSHNLERPFRQAYRFDINVLDFFNETRGLLAPELHEVRSLNPVREPRIVLNIGCYHELPAGLVACQNQGPHGSAARVDPGSVAGRAAADDYAVPDSIGRSF